MCRQSKWNFWVEKGGGRILGRKRYQAEQIISKLREAEVLLANAEFGTMSPYYSLIKLLSKYEPTYNPIYKIDFPAQGRGRPTNPDLVSSLDISPNCHNSWYGKADARSSWSLDRKRPKADIRGAWLHMIGSRPTIIADTIMNLDLTFQRQLRLKR